MSLSLQVLCLISHCTPEMHGQLSNSGVLAITEFFCIV